MFTGKIQKKRLIVEHSRDILNVFNFLCVEKGFSNAPQYIRYIIEQMVKNNAIKCKGTQYQVLCEDALAQFEKISVQHKKYRNLNESNQVEKN